MANWTEEETRRIRLMADDLLASYHLVSELYKERQQVFEKAMADVCLEIEALRMTSTRPGGVSFLAAAYLMWTWTPIQTDSEDSRMANYFKLCVKAATCWYMFRDKELSNELKKILKVNI